MKDEGIAMGIGRKADCRVAMLQVNPDHIIMSHRAIDWITRPHGSVVA